MSKAKAGGGGLLGAIILLIVIWVFGSYLGHRFNREHPPTKPNHSTPADHPMQNDLPTNTKSPKRK